MISTVLLQGGCPAHVEVLSCYNDFQLFCCRTAVLHMWRLCPAPGSARWYEFRWFRAPGRTAENELSSVTLKPTRERQVNYAPDWPVRSVLLLVDRLCLFCEHFPSFCSARPSESLSGRPHPLPLSLSLCPPLCFAQGPRTILYNLSSIALTLAISLYAQRLMLEALSFRSDQLTKAGGKAAA